MLLRKEAMVVGIAVKVGGVDGQGSTTIVNHFNCSGCRTHHAH